MFGIVVRVEAAGCSTSTTEMALFGMGCPQPPSAAPDIPSGSPVGLFSSFDVGYEFFDVDVFHFSFLS